MKSYGLSDEDIVVIPNGVDIRAFSPDVRLQKAADARASLGFVDADEVILFVGNEFHRKGLRCAIDALALGTPRQKLLVVGNADPAEYSQYAHRVGVQSRLRFTGSCTDMPAMYAAADLFLLPSSYEAFPLSLLEAAASGLALLATRVNGVEETIQHGDNGFFVTQEPAVIAAKIQQILENPELHRHMEAEARKTSLRYSWDNIMAETCTVYEAVLREKRNGMRHGHHRR
jgi:UDP-glucose:(heptosyl)LPS alpha-1,3-glucosyltransferase